MSEHNYWKEWRQVIFSVSDRRELIEKLDRNRNALLEFISQMGHQESETPWKEGDRSPKGQILHLVEAEHTYVSIWAKLSRDEMEPDLSTITNTFSKALGERDPHTLSLEDLIDMLHKQRISTYKFIAETADEEMNLVGQNTPFGNLSVHQFLKSLYRHDQMHEYEIKGIESSYIITNQDGQQI